MDQAKWIVGGVVGAGIGAAIWAGIGYATGYEIGWIAWGVGVLAGIGVAAAADGEEGWGPGIVAALCGLVGVLAGKYLAFRLTLGQVAGELGLDADQLNAVISFTDSLSAWDLLWLGLATFTAFQIGSGMASDE